MVREIKRFKSPADSDLTQLSVLAAAAVVAAAPPLPPGRALPGRQRTGERRNGLASRRRDHGVAFLAAFQAGPCAPLAARPLNAFLMVASICS
jgi:hypothetical protein